MIEWIPYSMLTNVKPIAEGGFSFIYQATWNKKTVIVKQFKNSQKISEYFLNEVYYNYYHFNYFIFFMSIKIILFKFIVKNASTLLQI